MSSSVREPGAVRGGARLKWAAFVLCIALAAAGTAIGLRSPMLHEYEYQEDIYPSLDGSATVYITGSIPALVALDALPLSTDPISPVDRAKLRAMFSGPHVTASNLSLFRRHGRRFLSLRVDTGDLRRLSEIAPLSRETYDFSKTDGGYRLTVQVAPSAGLPIPDVGWRGDERVGFRLHIPSKIESHNTLERNFLSGNILVWEQSLADRLAGVPLRLEVRMQPESILYRTLWLFALSAGSAVVCFLLFMWWVSRRGSTARRIAKQEAEIEG
jgi:hypothetical protein